MDDGLYVKSDAISKKPALISNLVFWNDRPDMVGNGTPLLAIYITQTYQSTLTRHMIKVRLYLIDIR